MPRPLPACPAGEEVLWLEGATRWGGITLLPIAVLALELLHLPDKPAGVGQCILSELADELLTLPGKPAGVGQATLPIIRDSQKKAPLSEPPPLRRGLSIISSGDNRPRQATWSFQNGRASRPATAPVCYTARG